MKKFITEDDFVDLPNNNYKALYKDAEVLGRSIAPSADGTTTILLGVLGIISNLETKILNLNIEVDRLHAIDVGSSEKEPKQ